MAIRLESLLAQCGGTLAGDGNLELAEFAPLARAGARQIAFVSDAKLLPEAMASAAAALIVRPEWADRFERLGRTLWLHENPYLAFARASQLLVASAAVQDPPGIDPSATVHTSATIGTGADIGPRVVIGAGTRIGENVRIGAGTVIGPRVQIGRDSLLHANVTIYADCLLGAQCIVHSGAVIGADGFGYARDGSRWIKIPQTGRVRIGDRVEIGANTTVDRGAMDDTIIGDGVKLDNLIQIAHNVEIGEDTAMAGCVGVAGSTKIGKRCTLAGSVGLFGHIEIADDVHISAATVVSKSITKPGRYTGYFPFSEHHAWERNAAMVRHLADLRSRVKNLESALADQGNKQGQDHS